WDGAALRRGGGAAAGRDALELVDPRLRRSGGDRAGARAGPPPAAARRLRDRGRALRRRRAAHAGGRARGGGPGGRAQAAPGTLKNPCTRAASIRLPRIFSRPKTNSLGPLSTPATSFTKSSGASSKVTSGSASPPRT